jgi:putative endonuclease
MFYTYILRIRVTGLYYTGSTSNLQVRFQQHDSDGSVSTKNRGPWDLMHHEEFAALAEAARRERYFKTGRGREALKKLVGFDQSHGPAG